MQTIVKGQITLTIVNDGASGTDAVSVLCTPPAILVNQDINNPSNLDSLGADTAARSVVSVYKGTTKMTVTKVQVTTTSHVSATGSNSNYVQLTAIAKSSGAYYNSGYVTLSVTYTDGGVSRTVTGIRLSVFANLLGTWSETIEADVKQGIAQSEWWDIDPTTGKIVESQRLGTFIQSSTANIAKLEQTVGDPQNPASGTLAYRTSAIEQHVDRIDLFVAEGSNLHPNPTFANYNPYINGTNHETGTLVGSVEYGSTIGNYTSIWANEGAKLVALKVVSNATTAQTVLYAVNSPTANPRIRLAAGKTYTWSVLVAGDLDMITSYSVLVEGSLYNSETGNERQSPWKYIRANSPVLWQDSEWKQLYATFEIPANSEYVWFSWIPLIEVLAGATGRIVYGGIRVEEGTKPTIINYNGTEDRIAKTGIDIQNGIIRFTSDNLLVENNAGDKTLWLDDNGNVGTSGNVFTGMTTIGTAAQLNKYFPSDTYNSGVAWNDVLSHEKYVYYKAASRFYAVDCDAESRFLKRSSLLVPDIFALSDIVNVQSVLTNGSDTQILLPLSVPRYYDGNYLVDLVRTETKFKTNSLHLLTNMDLYMLVGREFTFCTNQPGTAANKYYFYIPKIKKITNTEYYELDTTGTGNGVTTIRWGTSPTFTIKYERLPFRVPNYSGIGSEQYLITDGIVPVVKSYGGAFLYNNIFAFTPPA